MVKTIVGLVISRIQRDVFLVRARSLGIPSQRIVCAAEVKPGVRPLGIQFQRPLVCNAGFLPAIQSGQSVSPPRVSYGIRWLGFRSQPERTLRRAPVVGSQFGASALDQFSCRDRAGFVAEGWPCEQRQEEQSGPTGKESLHDHGKYTRSNRI